MLETRGVLEQAEAIYARRPSWVTFFREILGTGGLVRGIYTTDTELAEFEQSDAYRRIQHMLAKLRENDGELPRSPREPTRVITVRIPKSLHESLKAEAHQHATSMNKLCISKLLQALDASVDAAAEPKEATP